MLALVLMHIALLSAQLRSEEGQLMVRFWAQSVFAPFVMAFDWSTSMVESGFDWTVEIWEAREENRNLRSRIQTLQLENIRLRELAAFGPRLEEYESLERMVSFRFTMAGVIWRSAPFFKRRVLVNAGSSQGVQPDTAALTPRGIVGRVRSTTLFSAEVELITNPDAGASALVGPKRLPGIVAGNGGELLRLEFIPNAKEVAVGDEVIASGADGIYPKGFPIGEVVHSERGSMGQRDIRVKPYAEFDRLEEVALVIADLTSQDSEIAQELSGSGKH